MSELNKEQLNELEAYVKRQRLPGEALPDVVYFKGATALSLIAAARELEGRRWIPGSPTEDGRYWVVMWLMSPDRWEVRAVEIGSAVLVPGGRQLLKMSNGSAFVYEPNRYAIRWYMPAADPLPPVDLATLPPPPKEPTNGQNQ